MKEWTQVDTSVSQEKAYLYQREMAVRLGVTREYVIYLEKGVKKPSKTLKLFLDCIEREVNENEKGKEKWKHGKRHL